MTILHSFLFDHFAHSFLFDHFTSLVFNSAVGIFCNKREAVIFFKYKLLEIFCVKNQFSFPLRSRHVKTSLKLFSRYYLYASTVHILLCYSIFVEYSIALCHFSVFPVLYRFQLGLGSNPVPLHVLLPSVAISPQLTECCFFFSNVSYFSIFSRGLVMPVGPGPV